MTQEASPQKGITLDLDKLEERALAATPGPWIAENNERGDDNSEYWNIESQHGTICGDDGFWWPPSEGSNEANAKFVAELNPTTVLALIALARKGMSSTSAVAEAEAAPVIATDEMVESAIKAFNDFPCPENGSVARSWNREHMRAALNAALTQLPSTGQVSSVVGQAETEHVDDDAMIIAAVTNAHVKCVHPEAATTLDVGRVVLAAERHRVALQATVPAGFKSQDSRIQYLEALVAAYAPKSYQYDIEHPCDGLNAPGYCATCGQCDGAGYRFSSANGGVKTRCDACAGTGKTRLVPSTCAKDAERWRETLKHVGASSDPQRFVFRWLSAIKGANLMQGSVAQHFTEAIDAEIEASRAGGTPSQHK